VDRLKAEGGPDEDWPNNRWKELDPTFLRGRLQPSAYIPEERLYGMWRTLITEVTQES